MKNTFGWMQLQTGNTQHAHKFYEGLFQWQFQHRPKSQNGTYIEIDTGNGPCAGISQDVTQEPSSWVPFVNVNNIQKFTQKAAELGAKVIVQPTEIGRNEGFYSVFIDPTGATLGLYEPPKSS